MVRTVMATNAEGKHIEVKLRADALVMRRYRATFGRDMFQDMAKLQASSKKLEMKKKQYEAGEITQGEYEAAQFEMADLYIFENACYIMAKHADPENVPDTIDGWMEGLSVFSIQEILPSVYELWGVTQDTTAKPAKKQGR